MPYFSFRAQEAEGDAQKRQTGREAVLSVLQSSSQLLLFISMLLHLNGGSQGKTKNRLEMTS